MPPLTASAFAEEIDVSRETLERFDLYLDLLKRWQRAINLVGKKTLVDPWRRHILDCAQLMTYLPSRDSTVVDLGSGAGLPGLILAILGQANVHLVECDQRKAQFLKEVVRTLALDVTVHVKRIEAMGPISADVLTARALAPLPTLLTLAQPLLRPDTICLFLKGRHGKDELTEAKKSWMMASQIFPSLSDPSASILKLREIQRAPLHRQ
ncbi:MAG: 16S rRNA (guanine(527)-N(7))-methyltransferase RsmG [Geminicoccaceae bacterium]